MFQEIFPIVNEEGITIGSATRTECHSGSFLLHPVVHLHIFNSDGKLYLQKRAENKDIQHGKWDTSVGGHVDIGETIEKALKREVYEELFITDFEPKFAFTYVFQSDIERELVNSFYTIYDGEILPDKAEISEGKFWQLQEINENIGKNVFTSNFETEILKLKNLLSL